MASMATATPILRFPQLAKSNATVGSSLSSRKPLLRFQLQKTPHLYLQTTSRNNHIPFAAAACASSPDLKDIDTNPTSMEDRSIVDPNIAEAGQIKMCIDVSGDKSKSIFENVFSKMVAAAQPIPGFRRVKGGKTPNIPRDVLMEIIGPSKIYKQVIKKIINTAVADYVEKEKLKVTKDLKVEQSFEELETALEEALDSGEVFSFDVTIQLKKENV